MADIAALLVLQKKWGRLPLGGRGRLTCAAHRYKATELISEAHAVGAGAEKACANGMGLRMFKRWRKAFLGDGGGQRSPQSGSRHWWCKG